MEAKLRTVGCGKNEIEYCLTRKKVKNINLRIRGSDGTVQVSASPRVEVEYIDSFVLSNSEFILSALNKYRIEKAKAECFVENGLSEGNEIILLGRRLKIRLIKAMEERVVIDDKYVTLCLADTENYSNRLKILEVELNRMREIFFKSAVDKFYPVFKSFGVEYPMIVIKNSVSRWGYCQPLRSTIMMNKQLICVPEALMDYLALHELTHFLYPNHSAEFWNFAEQLMPDCRARRKALQQYSFLLKN